MDSKRLVELEVTVGNSVKPDGFHVSHKREFGIYQTGAGTRITGQQCKSCTSAFEVHPSEFAVLLLESMQRTGHLCTPGLIFFGMIFICVRWGTEWRHRRTPESLSFVPRIDWLITFVGFLGIWKSRINTGFNNLKQLCVTNYLPSCPSFRGKR